MKTATKENFAGFEKSNESKVGLIRCKTVLESQEDKTVPPTEVEKLKSAVKNNFQGFDFTLCVFVAALKSNRVDKCMRPFPNCFLLKNGEKDFASLVKAVNKIPPLAELVFPDSNIQNEAKNLLCWLFFDSGLPSLTAYPTDSLPISVPENFHPKYVFKVTYSSNIEDTWKKRRGQRDIFYAFHGSSINNFYSILRFGLHQHLSNRKEVLFGEGIYLSKEISVCANFAPFGETWKNSTLGFRHSVIAVCELIDDKQSVKCQDGKDKKRAINKNSYGEVPDKYFVVINSDFVKVKYLLVYQYKSPSKIPSILKQYFLNILICLYFLMLVVIRIYKPYWKRIVRYFYSFIE